MPPTTLEDAASSEASATENLGDATSARRQTDEALSQAVVDLAELPNQSSEAVASDAKSTPVKDSLTNAVDHGPASQTRSQDATTALKLPPPRPTTTPKPSIPSTSIRPKSTSSPLQTISNLKQASSMSIPLGSSESEDIMDLFSPPVSTKTRKNHRTMTVVTAADSVMRDSEEVILPFRGEGGLARERKKTPGQAGASTPYTKNQEDESPPNSSPDLRFDSSGEDFEAALQLTFEESPESNRARGSPLTASLSGKDSDIPTQFRPPQQRQLSKQHKDERRVPNQQQPPQQQGGPAPPLANQLQPPYHYPMFYPHPYGGPQMMAPSPTQMPHGYAFPVAGQHMMPGAVPMPGYGFPPWGTPPGQYYGYAQPHMAVPPPHQQYTMQPPETPASRKTPGTTPRTKTTTPGKRKDRRYDPYLTVETEDLSFDDIATPMSPPSSKKKRDGSLGIGTWPSPPDHDMNDDMGTNITPQRRSTSSSRSKRDPYSNTPRLASFDENFSFGATPGREIFQAPSWSPGAMGALFEDEGMLHGDNGESASLETWEMRTAFGDVENNQAQRHYSSAAPPFHSFVSDSSPSRAGVIIRGSPISSKAMLSAGGDEIPKRFTPTPQKSVKTEHSGRGASHTPSSSCGVRIRIGSGVTEKSVEKENVDDINSVLRGSPVSTRSSAPPARQGFPHPTALQPTNVNQNNMGYTGVLMPPANAAMTTPSSTRRAVGKENTDNERTSNPCNCKKSKCLKLYCECFAAEKYCFDCKCSNCQNTPQYESIREKAIADTKAKNPSAFQPRIAQSETEHATGCKCKKSACLKKYCECFEGGVVCGDNCKCSGCQNFIGSRSLMDRRRKMKDANERADSTMFESTEKAWRGSMSDSKARYGQSPIIHDPNRPILRSPIHHPFLASQPAYQPHPVMMGQSPIVYPHGMMYPPPPYSAPRADSYSNSRRGDQSGMQVPAYPHYPTDSTPDVTSFKRGFQQHPSKKQSSKKIEPRESFFGPNVHKQTKTIALSIFSYLSNEDLFNASIVSKTWSNLAFDNELWQPVSGEIRF